jgi:hypothetical protein
VDGATWVRRCGSGRRRCSRGNPKSKGSLALAMEPGAEAEGMPRWAKVGAILALLLAAAVLVLHLTGNSLGGHGP